MSASPLPTSERWFYGSSGLARTALVARPLGALYEAVMRARREAYARGILRAREAPCPVVSVGSPVVGGAGTTPGALWCAKALADSGAEAAILLRGYGRRDEDPALAWPSAPGEGADLDALGDEATMLASWLDSHNVSTIGVGVGADRLAALELLRARLPALAVAVLDDGLQHLEINRALDIVMVPPGVEKMAPLPAGPLRESLRTIAGAHLLWLHSGDGEMPAAQAVRGRAPDVISTYIPGEMREVWPREVRHPEVSASLVTAAATTLSVSATPTASDAPRERVAAGSIHRTQRSLFDWADEQSTPAPSSRLDASKVGVTPAPSHPALPAHAPLQPTRNAPPQQTSPDGPVVLLTAVGRNANVARMVRESGVEVHSHIARRDHAPFDARTLSEALRPGLPLLTTEKDWPRLERALVARRQADPNLVEPRVWTLAVAFSFARGEDALRSALLSVL